ncbi:uncharacterized protein L203_105111 [Cryptococcus depauperatus CBS 7841]|uniref:Protein kinase domain-containing protein n=1 Tax=Cryptococcus depauperatus CBS 7841 TaxID=1295531 RepID=A0AAJ8M3R2_9TREE
MTMVAPGRGGEQNGIYNQNQANHKQAQLTNAYQELAKELESDKVKVVGGYTLGRVIGEGAYGSVHLATHRLTGTRTAIKKIPKSFTPQLTREIHHHRRLHHPHIVHLYEIIATELHIWLVTELCSGGELFDYLVERGRMLEGEARRLFGELAVAVGWMHRQGVVHRDLKLENVLLDGELKIKLGDLGFVREWQRGRLMDTYCGTTGYASPEMLSCRKYLGVETDIWSLGIILYILLCGGLPFDDDDERVMKELIQKGKYQEPDWLSEEAKDLIRGMLMHDPAQRLSIENILTHPWFKLTIVDRCHPNGDSHSIPPSPNPVNPPADDFFAEIAIRHHSSRHSAHHNAVTSPLSLNPPETPHEDSENSEASASGDSERSKEGSGTTTPPTTTEGNSPPTTKPNSAGLCTMEKELELLHSNHSQSTIRPRLSSSSPRSMTESSLKRKIASKMRLTDQVEEEEEEEKTDEHTSLPFIDDHLHLPVAQHSRTPSRTKRRSVSSTLSLERRLSHHSHHGLSNQCITYLPEDYLAKLNEECPPPFSTPSEKHLLNQLNNTGMDIGQLKHSVETDACDSSAAMWWILKTKQAERGETDDVIITREKDAAKRKEKATVYAREERHKVQEAETDKGQIEIETPKFITTQGHNFIKSGYPVLATPNHNDLAPEHFAIKDDWRRTGTNPLISTTPIQNYKSIELLTYNKIPTNSSNLPSVSLPNTPPRMERLKGASVESSPQREKLKSRSPSITILQRATSVFVSSKKIEEKSNIETDISDGKEGQHGGSPTKLKKPIPMSKNLSKSENESFLNITARESPVSRSRTVTPSSSILDTVTPHGTPGGSAIDIESSKPIVLEGGKSKGSRRDSIWSAFRHLFYEDRRRRKREIAARSPLAMDVKSPPPAVVLSRGANSRPTQFKRVSATPGSKRTSFDGRPIYSRRSSSITSRRSSMGSMHLADHPSILNDLGRGSSQRSHGSQTPTSDKEFVDHPPSRPGSAHSLHRGGSRRSSLSIRSPSLQSETSTRFRNIPPSSPLNNYRRRPAGGNDSSRVRHIKVISEPQNIRSSSVASSVRSNASSRASSVEGKKDSEHESGRDDAPFRSGKRQKNRNGTHRSLAQQIHRTRSPLALTSDSAPPKKPLRDVFQSKGRNQEEDDEWISEEDEFACGLGQETNIKKSVITTTGSPAVWMDGIRAAATFPSTKITAPTLTSGRRRERNRRGSLEEDRMEKKSQLPQGFASQMENQNGWNRRALPGRSTAPGIIEEEEENEE